MNLTGVSRSEQATTIGRQTAGADPRQLGAEGVVLVLGRGARERVPHLHELWRHDHGQQLGAARRRGRQQLEHECRRADTQLLLGLRTECERKSAVFSSNI